MDRIPVWKRRRISQLGRASIFQVIASIMVLIAIYVTWHWRAGIAHVPQYLVPGLFVAFLGLVGVGITLRPSPMSKGEKIFWIIVATALCVCDVIVLESAAKEQIRQFEGIMGKFDEETRILTGMNENTIRLSQRPVVVKTPAVTVKTPLQLQRESFGNLYDRILELSQTLLQLALDHQYSRIPVYKPYSREWLQWNARSFKFYEKRLDGIVSECKALHIEDTELNENIGIAKLGLRPTGVDDPIYMAMSAEDIRRIAARLTVLADDVKKAQP